MTHLSPHWTGFRRGHRLRILIIIAAALALAVHLGLGGYLLTHTRWTVGAAVVVGAVVLVKLLVILLGRKAIRHQRATPEPPTRAP